MKNFKNLLFIFAFLLIGQNAFANSAPIVASPVQPQSIDFNICNKYFRLDNKSLFYLTMTGINANKFTINEIKSKNGYILFTVAQKQYLASVIKVDSKNSLLKITPCDNKYYFPSGIVQNLFKYIELNEKTGFEPIQTL